MLAGLDESDSSDSEEIPAQKQISHKYMGNYGLSNNKNIEHDRINHSSQDIPLSPQENSVSYNFQEQENKEDRSGKYSELSNY